MRETKSTVRGYGLSLREREERVRDERAGQADQEDGSAADPVREPSPERREDELHAR